MLNLNTVNTADGRGRFEAVKQRLAGQVVVDQSGDDPDFGATEPNPDVFWTVFHEKGDTVPGLVAETEEKVRHAI